jgi:hypothetical protein
LLVRIHGVLDNPLFNAADGTSLRSQISLEGADVSNLPQQLDNDLDVIVWRLSLVHRAAYPNMKPECKVLLSSVVQPSLLESCSKPPGQSDANSSTVVPSTPPVAPGSQEQLVNVVVPVQTGGQQELNNKQALQLDRALR